MATLLSSPLGPSSHNVGRYDIFDQPSSPVHRHAELPAEFGDQSFGSSMSLGSSFELNRMAASSSTSSQLSVLSVSALGPRRVNDDQQTTLRLPRRSPPRSSQDGLGASMGTILNSKSPHLAAKMNTSDYMDMSSPPPSARRKGAATPSKSLSSDKDENLPPGSAMKEDTPVKHNQSMRRALTEAPASTGASLGRLFGTELSLNTRHQSFQTSRLSKLDDDSFSSQNSPDKEPPSKRRPSSLPLVPGPICNRPILRSNGATPSSTSGAVPNRRSGLLKSMTTNQTVDGKIAKKRASLEALHQRNRASDTIVASARTFTMGPPRRSRSGSSEDRDVCDLLPRTSLPPLHPTIIESPSPSALQHEDFGTYFFDPQSPEHAKVMVKPSGISSRLNPASAATQSSNRQRTFEKAASSAVLPSMLSVASSGSTLGKRTNPYAKRPSLSAIQNHKLGAEKQCGPAASTSNSIGSARMTAPAPRRCQSAIDNSAAFAQAAEDLTMNSVDTSADQSGLMSPSEYRLQCASAAIRQFPPGFDASGSPLAPSARPKMRPGMLRKTSKDDSSPLGYGISKRLTQKASEGLHAIPLCVDESASSSSPMRAAEGLPGFGASEREGKVLPCFNIKDDGLMRITPATLVKVMKGVYSDVMESFQIVDCRFGYEYEGGHIAGAINLSTMERVKSYFLQPEGSRCLPIRSQSGKPDARGVLKKQVLIFHCEFSAKRAPSMALALRQADRSLAHDYPNCHYPEVYILQGGYCGFYKEYADACEPRHYVQMDDPKFQDKRSKELNGFRKQFARHRSFTYGDGANAAAKLPHSDGTLLNNPSFGRPIQEESSFENSKSPSAIQADVAQARRKGMSKGNNLRIDTVKGLGEKPLLGSAPANIGELSFGSSLGDESSSFEGGPTDSPCAAAAAAAASTTRSRPAPIFLKPGNSKTFSAKTGSRLLVAQDARATGGSLGRHTFQRAATAAHIQLR